MLSLDLQSGRLKTTENHTKVETCLAVWEIAYSSLIPCIFMGVYTHSKHVPVLAHLHSGDHSCERMISQNFQQVSDIQARVQEVPQESTHSRVSNSLTYI